MNDVVRTKFDAGRAQTADELEAALGASLKAMRLSRNISQKDLAERAGVGTTALKNLENGEGAKVATLVRVVRALGRESWLENAGPVATINPLALVQNAKPRQRAFARKKPRTGAGPGQSTTRGAGGPGDSGREPGTGGPIRD